MTFGNIIQVSMYILYQSHSGGDFIVTGLHEVGKLMSRKTVFLNQFVALWNGNPFFKFTN